MKHEKYQYIIAFTFAKLLIELQRLDQTQRFVDRPSDRQIVDRLLPDYAVRVDDEGAAQSDSLVLDQHSVVGRNGLGQVGQQWVFQRSDATILSSRE